MIEFLNEDCMIGMSRYPDKYFDLAIVDPVYGIDGYMQDQQGKFVGSGKGKQKNYNSALWKQDKTGTDYFKELFRISKNQVIWGGITSSIAYILLNVGLYGINNIAVIVHLLIVN